MAGTSNESTTASGPPTTVYIYPGGRSRCTIVAIEQLARLVAALPLQHFLPLHSAFAQAKDRLGSYSLAARDLTQYARARRLTVAVRVIWPDGTEQAFILRSVFWRWYGIFDSRSGTATVRQVCGNSTTRLGDWHLFVGRRRFERLYSVSAPSKPTPKKPPPDPEQWLAPMRAKFAQLPSGRKSAWVRDKAFPQMRQELGDRAPWHTWDSLKRAMQSGRRKKI